jgi:hypothetical protein
MSFNGYVIENLGSKLSADLRGGKIAPGNDVIVHALNQLGGTLNQNVCRRYSLDRMIRELTVSISGGLSLSMDPRACGSFNASSRVRMRLLKEPLPQFVFHVISNRPPLLTCSPIGQGCQD